MKTILVSNTEPKDMLQLLRIKNIQYGFNFVIKSAYLEVSDYVCKNEEGYGNIGIERKSKEDFLASIIDGRIFIQMINMNENFDRNIILIEGNISDVYSQLNDNSKIGTLTAAIVKYGISIVPVPDKDWSTYFILSILKHSGEKIDLTKLFRLKISDNEREIGAISCAKGWGFTLAKEICKYYRIRDLANIRDLNLISSKIKGVGAKKAQNLIDLFSGFEKDKYFMTEVDILNFKKYINLIIEYKNKKINVGYSKIYYDQMIDILKKYDFTFYDEVL